MGDKLAQAVQEEHDFNEQIMTEGPLHVQQGPTLQDRALEVERLLQTNGLATDANYENQVGVIMSLTQGDLSDESIEIAERKAQGLITISTDINNLQSIGAEQQYLQASLASFDDYGTKTEARATDIHQLTDLRYQNDDILKTNLPNVQETKLSMDGLVTSLGTASVERREYDATLQQGVAQQVQEYSQNFKEARTLLAGLMLHDISKINQELEAMRNQRDASKKYRDSLDKFYKKTREVQEKISNGEKIDEEEFAQIDTTMAYIRRADAVLGGIESRSGTEVASTVYANAIDAMSAGNTEDAKVQFFLAEETAEAAKVSKSTRDKIADISDRLAKGEISSVEAKREMGTHFADQLQAQAKKAEKTGIKDEEIKSSLAAITESLGSEHLSLEDLQRAKIAISMTKLLRKVPKNAREGALKIFRRGFKALEIGLPLDYAKMQKKLAEMYINAGELVGEPALGNIKGSELIQWRRNEIEKASKLLETGQKLNAIHILVQHGLSPEEAAKRLFGKGDDSKEIARLYSELGADVEKEILRIASYVGLFTEASEGLETFSKLDKKDKGMSVDHLINTFYLGMEDLLRKICDGEKLSDYEGVVLQGLPKLYEGKSEDVVAFFSVLLGAPAAVPMTEGLVTVKEGLKGLKGETRQNTARIYAMAIDELNVGDPQAALVHMILAQAYANGSKKERELILDLAIKLADGEIGVQKASWLARTFFERSRMELNDETHQQVFNDYSNLAMKAYENGDMNGADLLSRLAILYGTAAKFDPEEKAIIEVLGIADGNGAIPSLEEIKKAMEEGKTVLEAVDLTPRDLEIFYLRLASLELSVNEIEFNSKIAMGKFELGDESSYKKETKRLSSKHEKAEDTIEAGRLERESEIVDSKEMFARFDEAKETYKEGADLIREGIDKRTLAFSVQDEETRSQMLVDASSMIKKGQSLIIVAEGQLEALDEMHRSISDVKTLKRDAGRSYLFLAYNTFEDVADTISEDENVTDSEYQGHQMRMNQSYSDIQLGTFQIDEQLSIQEIKKSLLVEGRRLTKQNDNNDNKFGHVRLPNSPGAIGPTLPAYDKKARQGEIDKGLTYAKRERFKGSARQFRISSTSMALDLQLVDVSSRYWRLVGNSTDAEKETGMEYFKTWELIGQVETARGFAYKGKLSDAEQLMGEITSAAIVQGAKQEKNNQANMIRAYETLLRNQAKNTILWGLGMSPDEVDFTNPEAIDALEKIKLAASYGDPGKRCHMEIVMGIRNLGIMSLIAKDQNAEADRFAALAELAEQARDEIDSTGDVIKNSREKKRLGMWLFNSIYYQTEKEVADLKDQGKQPTTKQEVAKYHLRQMAADYFSGDYDKVLTYLLDKPEMMEYSVSHLTKDYEFNGAIGKGLLVDSQLPKQIERYQEHAIGWNYSMTLASRALEMYDFADMLYRARVDSALGRDVIRDYAGELLMASYWAGWNPGQVKEYILTDRDAISTGVDIYFRKDSGVFEDVRLKFGWRNIDLNSLLGEKTYLFYDAMQDISQGLGEAPEPTDATGKALKEEMGDRMYFIMFERHEAAVQISNLDTMLTMASLGFIKDKLSGKWKTIEMTKEQQEVLQEAVATIGMVRGQYLNISTSLKRFTSYDDAKAAFETLNELSGEVNELVEPILLGREVDSEKIREEMKELTESKMDDVQAHIDEGVSDDTYLNYAETGVKIIGAGFLTATGFGVPVAAMFLAESLYTFQESIIMAGGYDYMSTEQKVLNWGGVGLSALGFGVGGLSSISTTLRTTSTVATATKGFKILEGTIKYSGYGLIAGGVMMGGLQIYDMYAHNPNAGALDYGFAFFNAAQPFLQMGATRVVGLKPNLAYSNTFGAKSYRGFMAGMFGVGKGELVNVGLLKYNQRYAEAITSLNADSRVQIDKIEGQINRRLDPGEVKAVLDYFGGRAVNSQEAAAVLKRFDGHVGARIKSTLATDESLTALVDIHRVRPLEATETLLLLDEFGANLPKPEEAIKFLDTYAKEGGAYYDILKFSQEHPDKGIYSETSHRAVTDEILIVSDVMKRHDANETLNQFENNVVSRVNELIQVRGISQENAVHYVAEERTSPHKVGLSAEVTGMPPDFYAWSVPTIDGGDMILGEAPRAVLHEYVGSGAGGYVYFGETIINGQKKDVAIKVFTNVMEAPDGSFDYAGRFKYDVQEMKSLKVLSDLGLGPEVYGFVDVDGNYAIAMERIGGKALDEMNATEIRQHVTPETYKQLEQHWKTLTDAGYTIGDFQFAVLTKDQTINGVLKKSGDVVIWDAGALRTIQNKGEAHYTPDEVVISAQNTADLVIMEDFLGVIDPNDRKVLEKYARGVTGSKHKNGDFIIKQFLRMGRAKRSAKGEEYLNALNNPDVVDVLKQLEADSGVKILPANY